MAGESDDGRRAAAQAAVREARVRLGDDLKRAVTAKTRTFARKLVEWFAVGALHTRNMRVFGTATVSRGP